MCNSNQTTSGMTLVELVVLIGIYTLLLLAITSAIQSFYQQNSYTIPQAQQVNSARRGLDSLIADIREMTEAEDGSYPVRIIEPYRIGFFSDVDRDAAVEYVEFELIGTDLHKRIYKSAGSPPAYDFNTPDELFLISTYVQNNLENRPIFQYFDTNQIQMSSTSPQTLVRFIRLEIIVNIDPFRSPGEFMLRSSVAPRNLKDNL